MLEGIEGDEKEEIKLLNGKYEGGKWGGIYLRAPEIYFTILEKGKGKFVKLGDIAEVRFGIKTGANEFFYVEDVTDKIDFDSIKIINLKNVKTFNEIKQKGLRIVRNTKTGDYWLIEEEFLKPVIKSPRECKSIIIKQEDLKYKVIMCHKSKDELKNENAFILDYIEWGENKNFQNISTVSNRKKWYGLPKLPDADILFNQFFNERFIFPWNKEHYLVDHSYYYIIYQKNTEALVFVLNSAINFLMVEIYGRTGLGEGSLQTYAPEMKHLIVLNPNYFQINKKNLINDILKKYSKYKPKSIFTELSFDPNKPIREQEPNPLPDRKALDDIVFDVIGLTEEERKEVYWAVAELVQNRLKKAKSV